MKETESSRGITRVEQKFKKKMKKLVKKQQKEIDELPRIWDEYKVQLLEKHRQKTALASPRHSNSPEKLNEHKRLDDELKNELENHKNKRETGLKNLKTRYLAKKTKIIEKKARRLEKMKSSSQVKPLCTTSSAETDPDYPVETPTPTIGPSPNCEPNSANDSDINILAKLSSDEEQLPDEPLTSVENVREAARNEFTGGLHGPEDTIISVLCSSGEQLPDIPPSSVEVIRKACSELRGGLLGSVNDSQIGFVTTPPSSDVQLPLGASPSVEEGMTSAGNELHEHSQSQTRAEMENTEAPAQTYDGQLPIEVGESERTVHEEILTNLSEQLRQPPSVDIPGDTNLPTASTSPPCDNRVLMLVIPSEHQLLQPSAETPVGSNQPTSFSPSPGCDHELILMNSSKSQQLSSSVNIPVDMNQATSASTSIVEQLPCSQELLASISMEAPQPSHCPQFLVNTNPCHPVPTSVVEQAPRREINIVTLNAQARTQYENSQSPTNQSTLLVNQPDPHIAVNYNPEEVVGTPVPPDQLNFQTHSGITPSISSSSVGDLRSYPMLQGVRQVAPQITAQRLTFNPLYNEYQRLCRESESLVESHENMKLQLKYDCEKELTEIRKKYELKLEDAEAAFSVKKKELDMNSTKVWMHGLYAQSFQDMAEYKSATKLPQDASSNPTQQVLLPHSQAQPLFSPSISTSPDCFLSACNRQNRPRLNTTITPSLLNFQNNTTQAPSLFQSFRPPPPFSATYSASTPPRVPPHLEPPRIHPYQSTRFSRGPQFATGGGHPSFETPSSSRSTVFSYPQNQIGRLPSTFLPSVSASSSNLDLVPQFMAASTGVTQGTCVSADNGVSRGTNMRHSESTPGLICLSDDE